MSKKVVFSFGRFQSPTIGHEKLINKTKEYADSIGAEHRVYPSPTYDDFKNPIPHSKKISYLKSMFPDVNFVSDKTLLSPHHVAKSLSDDGYSDVTMVAGDDRVKDFKQSIGKYVRTSDHPEFDKDKHYNFKKFNVISAGERDPSAQGSKGASGTKMREYARKGDFKSFAKHTPTKNALLARKIYNTLRSNLKEDYNLINETIDHKSFGPMLDAFVSFAADKLGIDTYPKIILDTNGMENSFAAYVPHSKDLIVSTKNRHPMDIFRSVSHEMVHLKQDNEGRIGDPAIAGETGSDIENEANAEAGKIMRWFAQENPKYFKLGYVTEENLNEGVYDPAIHKVVFLAGGSGSGKDFILKRTLQGHGLKEINSDKAFEHILKKHNLPLDMQSMSASQTHQKDILRDRAKMITKQNQSLALHGRHGLIINGTADDFVKIAHMKNHYEDHGYKTAMVFVDTSDEVSKQRNEKRERKVPEHIRKQKWTASQKNKEHFKAMFGNNFHHIHNNHDYRTATPDEKGKMDADHQRIFKNIRAFTQEKNDNPVAKSWVNRELSKKKSMFIKEALNTPSDREWGKDSLVKIYSEMTPGQKRTSIEVKSKRKLIRRADRLNESVKKILNLKDFLKNKNKIEIKKEQDDNKSSRKGHLGWAPDDIVIDETPPKGTTIHEMVGDTYEQPNFTPGTGKKIWKYLPMPDNENPQHYKDVQINPEHKLYDNPNHPANIKNEKSIAHMKEFHKTLNSDHIKSIMHYKGGSYDINNHLRSPQKYEVSSYLKDHIHNLDHITSNKTKHDMVVYRGMTNQRSKNNKRFYPENYPKGTVFKDHGFIGTSLNVHTASEWSSNYHSGPKGKELKHPSYPHDNSGHHMDKYGEYKFGEDQNSHVHKKFEHDVKEYDKNLKFNQEKGIGNKRYIFKIHVPKGSKGHYLDHQHNAHDHEREFLLHRGTTFKVTHHSSDDDHHFIHVKVVKQDHHIGHGIGGIKKVDYKNMSIYHPDHPVQKAKEAYHNALMWHNEAKDNHEHAVKKHDEFKNSTDDHNKDYHEILSDHAIHVKNTHDNFKEAKANLLSKKNEYKITNTEYGVKNKSSMFPDPFTVKPAKKKTTYKLKNKEGTNWIGAKPKGV